MKKVSFQPIIPVVVALLLVLELTALLRHFEELKTIAAIVALSLILIIFIRATIYPVFSYNEKGFQRNKGAAKESRFYNWNEIEKIEVAEIFQMIAFYVEGKRRLVLGPYMVADYKNILKEIISCIKKNNSKIQIPPFVIKQLEED